MGVVRREGNWRLEKQDEGIYEITYEKQLQMKVLTSKYSPGFMDTHAAGVVPVHEVDSYTEAEGIFEERAHSNRTPGIAPSGIGSASDNDFGGLDTDISSLGSNFDELGDTEKLPPGGLAFVTLLVGGLFIRTSGFEPGSIVFVVGASCLAFGAGILSWAIYSTDSLVDAVNYLMTVEDSGSSSTKADDESEKTPPAPQALKEDLYFERAEQECEWCGNHVDQPEVHHIEPRSEGGPNTPKNLIVLCPNCHRKADTGAISRTKLRGKLRRLQGA